MTSTTIDLILASKEVNLSSLLQDIELKLVEEIDALDHKNSILCELVKDVVEAQDSDPLEEYNATTTSTQSLFDLYIQQREQQVVLNKTLDLQPLQSQIKDRLVSDLENSTENNKNYNIRDCIRKLVEVTNHDRDTWQIYYRIRKAHFENAIKGKRDDLKQIIVSHFSTDIDAIYQEDNASIIFDSMSLSQLIINLLEGIYLPVLVQSVKHEVQNIISNAQQWFNDFNEEDERDLISETLIHLYKASDEENDAETTIILVSDEARYGHYHKTSSSNVTEGCLYLLFEPLRLCSSSTKLRVGSKVLVPYNTEYYQTGSITSIQGSKSAVCLNEEELHWVDTAELLLCPLDPQTQRHWGCKLRSCIQSVSDFISDIIAKSTEHHQIVHNTIWKVLGPEFDCAEELWTRFVKSEFHSVSLKAFSIHDDHDKRSSNGKVETTNESVTSVDYYVTGFTRVMSEAFHTLHGLSHTSDSNILTRKLLKLVAKEFNSMKALAITVAEDCDRMSSLIKSKTNVQALSHEWGLICEKMSKARFSFKSNWNAQTIEEIEEKVQHLIYVLTQAIGTLLEREWNELFAPNIYENDWSSLKAYFSDTRCSHGLQMIFYRMSSVGILHHRIVTDIVGRYLEIIPSRARVSQFQIDSLYAVLSTHALLLKNYSSSSTSSIWTKCMALLTRTMCLCAPFSKLERAFEKFDNSKRRHGLKWHPEAALQMFPTTLTIDSSNHQLVFSTDEKDAKGGFQFLKDVPLEVEYVISHTNVDRVTIATWLEQRHELTTWEYPVLTSEDQLQIPRIKKVISRLLD